MMMMHLSSSGCASRLAAGRTLGVERPSSQSRRAIAGAWSPIAELGKVPMAGSAERPLDFPVVPIFMMSENRADKTEPRLTTRREMAGPHTQQC
jgi:hypothetical protein